MTIRMIGSDGLRYESAFVPAAACCSSCCHCWTCCCCCCSAASVDGIACSVLDDMELRDGLLAAV